VDAKAGSIHIWIRIKNLMLRMFTTMEIHKEPSNPNTEQEKWRLGDRVMVVRENTQQTGCVSEMKITEHGKKVKIKFDQDNRSFWQKIFSSNDVEEFDWNETKITNLEKKRNIIELTKGLMTVLQK